MEKSELQNFKEKLMAERNDLVNKLSGVGTVNPNNPSDWEALPGETGNGTADPNDFADTIESYEENNALVTELEAQLKDVNSALEKIEAGTYGICEISGEPIEMARLEANPAARTCLKHRND